MPTSDPRHKAAAYYDLAPPPTGDVRFFRQRMPSPDARVLELGCGTGRVLTSLVGWCGFVHGIDSSEAMLARCRAKLAAAAVPPERASVAHGDITRLDLGCTFDLILVPWVLQMLATDHEVDGALESIRTHLGAAATCVLSTPAPPMARDELRARWCAPGERLLWESRVGSVHATCHERRLEMDPDSLVLYPELVCRRREAGVLADETVMGTVVRCWYPRDLRDVVARHGFEVVAS
jgi:SAM-dependent methyltransferase